ncbi:MAG: TRAP transporter substrate-binding protein [Lachnospiraceae bacterium]|nr:TRAP transporter substrate-binding protein [Lachnospiraceae bacterium]
MKKLVSLAMAAAMTLSLAAAPAFAAEEDYGEYNWTLAMTVSETTTNYKMVEYFANLVNEKSNGSITIDLYPGGQLANTTEQDEAVVAGSIDMVTGMTADLTDFVKEMALFDMPNVFDSIDHMRNFLEGDYAKTQINEYCEASGIHMIAFSDAGFRQLTTNVETKTVEDLKNQKIRVMTNKYHIAYWNEVANAVPMQFNELFMGLQQGTVDGQENPYMNIVGNNLQEVQKYVVETNHVGHIIVFFMNNDLYQSLPDNTKALIDECAAEAAEFAKGVANESIELDKQTVVDAGCEIVTFSDEDLATLREKAQVVYDMVREDLGDDTVQQFMDAIDAAR